MEEVADLNLKNTLATSNIESDALMRLTPGGICRIVCDDVLTIQYANEYFYKIFEYTAERAAAAGFNSIKFITYGPDFADIKRIMETAATKLEPQVELETRQLTRTGKIIWVLARCQLHEGNLNSFTCVFIDITERKRVTDDLRASEEEYRIVLQQHTEKIIIRYDFLTRTLTRPQWAADMLNVPAVMENIPYSMVEQGWIAEESVAEYIAFYESMLVGEPQGTCLLKLYDQRWYRVDYTLIYNEAHEPLRSIISYEDVTEQRERMVAYEKWRQYNETLLENCIAYYECNLTKNLFDRIDGALAEQLPQQIRDSFSMVVQYAADHFVYLPDREIYLRLFSRETLLSQYYKGKREFQAEYRRKNEQGKTFWALTTIQLLPDPYSEDIKGFVLIQDVNQQKREAAELHKRLRTDPLTGLLNRRTIVEEIDHCLKDAAAGACHAFIMIDIDHFKALNDTLGHLFGDQVLIEIAATLRSLVRSEDLVSRLGGDEFVIFLRNCASYHLVERKVRLICGALFKRFEQNIVISGSLGIALAPADGASFMELYQKADAALYRAKQCGRNQCMFFQEGIALGTVKMPQEKATVQHTLSCYMALRNMFAELFELNVIADTYQLMYHAPHKYVALPGSGSLKAGIDEVAEQMIYPGDQARFREFFDLEQIRAILEQGHGLLEEEFRKLQENGEYGWVELSLVPVLEESGSEIVLCFVRDIDAKKQLQERAVEYDPLTGYLNFEQFRIKGTEILRDRGAVKYSLWYCDFKNFKFINDIYGYEFGDRVLRYWSKSIADSMRDSETFVRRSADHFMIIRRYESRDELMQRFQTMVGLLERYEELKGKAFKLELVVGAYLIERPEDVLSINDMVDRANIAKGSAKEEGGSKIMFYTETMRNQIIYEKEIEAEMHQALQRGEFCVYLQPQVDIQRGNQITGAEALVRWKRADGTVVAPNNFIPLFERNGFIVKLDRFVFEESCRYLRRRLATGQTLFKIAVNVSRISAFQEDFAQTYIQIKDWYNIPDELMEIEFTETVVVDNAQRLDGIMKGMRSNGFLFSLDDFGSGYSSLNMLKDIIVDVLKLDMMFFRNGLDRQREETIIASVIVMARELNMKVIAEGVETEEQVQRLKNLGCDIVQGYYFGRPVPEEEFDRRYAELWKEC